MKEKQSKPNQTITNYEQVLYFMYMPPIESGSDQLIVTLCTLSRHTCYIHKLPNDMTFMRNEKNVSFAIWRDKIFPVWMGYVSDKCFPVFVNSINGSKGVTRDGGGGLVTPIFFGVAWFPQDFKRGLSE